MFCESGKALSFLKANTQNIEQAKFQVITVISLFKLTSSQRYITLLYQSATYKPTTQTINTRTFHTL